jgi:hypothetical protein
LCFIPENGTNFYPIFQEINPYKGHWIIEYLPQHSNDFIAGNIEITPVIAV